MPICTRCRYGFESDLSRCPRCGTAIRMGRQSQGSVEHNSSGLWLGVLGLLFVVGLLSAIGLTSLTPLAVAFFLGVLLLYVWSILWAYGDAEARNKPGCAVALLVALLSWPIGLLVWIIFRP